jgi:hypothetical protein
LAARIRKAFPRAYDDLDDATLEGLWLAKHPEDAHLPRSGAQAEPRGYMDTALDVLPAVGGAVGGTIGGLGGTAFGMGFGGIPGAMGGAALGAAGGEGFREFGRAVLHGGQVGGPKDLGYTGNPNESAADWALGMAGDVGRSLQGPAIEGGIGALTEGGTRLAMAGLGAAGRRVLRGNLHLPEANSEIEALRNAEITRTAEQEGTNVHAPKSLARVIKGRAGPGGAMGSTFEAVPGPNGTVEWVNRGGGQGGVDALAGDASNIINNTSPRPVILPNDVGRNLTVQKLRFAPAGAAQADRDAVARVANEWLQDTSTPLHSGYKVPATGAGGANRMTPAGRMFPVAMEGPDVWASRKAAGASLEQAKWGMTQGAETEARKELYHQLTVKLQEMYPGMSPQELTAIFDRERRLLDLNGVGIRAANRGMNSTEITARYLAPALGGALYGSQGNNGGIGRAALYTGAGLALGNPRLETRAALLALMAARHPELLAIPAQLAVGGAASSLDDESNR